MSSVLLGILAPAMAYTAYKRIKHFDEGILAGEVMQEVRNKQKEMLVKERMSRYIRAELTEDKRKSVRVPLFTLD